MQPRSDQKKKGCIAFDAILAPISLAQFLTDTFGQAPLHLHGASGRFRNLLDWDGLAHLLETHHLVPPRLQIVKAGKTIPGDRYLRSISDGIDRIDGGALSLLLDTGATVIINHIDNLLPAVAALVDEVGDSLGARTAANLYASWRTEHGFNPHADYHDVIVLQLGGRKQWTIHKPTRPDPLRGDAFEELPADAVPEVTEILEEGHVLYLPRGWVHAPIPLDEPSLHLTIGIVRPTGAGFLAWLAKDLEDDPQVRAALPLADDPSNLVGWKARLIATICAALDEGAVEQYLIYKDAKRGARPRFSFPNFGRTAPAEWDHATTLRSASLHRFIVNSSADGDAQVAAMGRTWPCSRSVATALARITSTHSVTLGELEATLGESDTTQLRQILGLLATFGLLSTGKS